MNGYIFDTSKYVQIPSLKKGRKMISANTLGQKLKTLRMKRKIEQETVARVLNIPRSALTKIEDGSRELTALELANMCKIYGTTPNDILNFNEEIPE